MKQNPFKNVGEIHKEWTAAVVSASRTTMHRRMQDMGFSCRIPCQATLEQQTASEASHFSVKFPQSVMVWGAMSSAGVGPLCFLRSKVNTAVYQEVLEHFMLPAADQLYGDADFIFQQDLAPAHSAKATSTWFKDHGIPVLNGQQTRLTLTP